MKKKQCTIGRKDIGPKEPDVLRNLTCNGRLRAAARTAQKMVMMSSTWIHIQKVFVDGYFMRNRRFALLLYMYSVVPGQRMMIGVPTTTHMDVCVYFFLQGERVSWFNDV